MKSRYSIYAATLGMICLAVAGNVFLTAKEKSTELSALEATIASSREELAKAMDLERKVSRIIQAPPAGYVPAKAEERMMRSFLDLPRIIHELGLDLVEIKSLSNPSGEGSFLSLSTPLPMFENIRQGEIRLSVRFEDLASVRSLLESVEKMGGYVKSGKVQNTQAEFVVGFVGV